MIKELFQRKKTSQPSAEYALFDQQKLQKTIHYKFKDPSLLILALKHRSYLSVTSEENYKSNERLELLGDAVLELITTDFLYHQYKHKDEGTLSQMRSVLVSRSVLGKIAAELDLGQFLLLNKGEDKTGGRTRHSNLANLFEALIGGIYLDGGYNPARKFVEKFVLQRKDELLSKDAYFNYKSALLELSQSKGWGYPVYKNIQESGPDHDKRFLIMVEIKDIDKAQGSGASKKKAEQKAAASLLKKIDPEIFMDLTNSGD